MADIQMSPRPLDPYKNFKFRVFWDGVEVAGVCKVGALKRSTEVVEHRRGGDLSTAYKSPGRSKFDAVTLERGVTHDKAFHDWAALVWNVDATAQGSQQMFLKQFRKNITLSVFNEAGQKVLDYELYNCWVSEYQTLPDLDANANAVAIEHIKIENEGWKRTDFTEDA